MTSATPPSGEDGKCGAQGPVPLVLLLGVPIAAVASQS